MQDLSTDLLNMLDSEFLICYEDKSEVVPRGESKPSHIPLYALIGTARHIALLKGDIKQTQDAPLKSKHPVLSMSVRFCTTFHNACYDFVVR